MQTPRIFEQDTPDTQQPERLYTDTDSLPATSVDLNPTQSNTGEKETELTPTAIIATGETLQRREDGKFYIANNLVVQIAPQGLPTHILCRVQVDSTTREHTVAVGDLLLVATSKTQVPITWEAEWFSAYIRARSALRACIEIVFTETSVGEALRFAWGCEDFLHILAEAKEQLPLLPSEFSEAASLFAACLCLETQLSTLIDHFVRLDLAPFVIRVMGGHAFLDICSQIEQAYVQLPAFRRSHGSPPVVVATSPMRLWQSAYQDPTHKQISVILKEDEAPQLREEIVEQVKLQQPLFLAMITLGLTLLSVAVQPNISGLIAAFLPLTALALALALNIHSLRAGQLNFIQRYVLRSPYEIVRRYLFDGHYPNETEWQVLKEQGIEITQEMLNAARKLRSPFHDQRSIANWTLFLSFEGLSIGILVLRTATAFWHGDLLTILAWLSAIAATVVSIIVLKHTRVRKSL